MVVEVVPVDTAQQVSTLISTFTVVLVPVIGALVMSVVNFINHHLHTTPNQRAALDRVAKLEGQFMTVDKEIDAQKGAIAAVAAADPNVSKAVASHEAQITVAEAKIAQLADEITKIKSAVPTS